MRLELITLSQICFCAADVYMLYRFFNSLFQKKITDRRIMTIWFMTITVLIFLENAWGNITLNLLTVPIMYLLFIMIAFRISIGNGIVYTIIFYAIFVSGREVSFELLYRLLSGYLPVKIEWTSETGIYFLLVEYVLGFLFLRYIETYTRKLEINENKVFAWYLLVLPISSMLILSSFVYMDFPQSNLIQGLMCGGAFLLYFSNAAIFIMLAAFTNIMNQVKDQAVYSMRQSMEDDNYKRISELNEKYRSYMHDIHKYLTSIRSLALKEEGQKIIDMIDEVEGAMQESLEDQFYNGNKVMNTILLERKAKAKSQGIELSIFVERFLRLDFISDIDMVSMFGNLLDNALDAAALCEENQRYIDVKMFMGNEYMLVFYVENSLKEPVSRDGDKLLSTKKGVLPEHHGLGIGIVQTLAEKYGGSLSLEDNGKYFEATLILSASKPAQSANFAHKSV